MSNDKWYFVFSYEYSKIIIAIGGHTISRDNDLKSWFSRYSHAQTSLAFKMFTAAYNLNLIEVKD